MHGENYLSAASPKYISPFVGLKTLMVKGTDCLGAKAVVKTTTIRSCSQGYKYTIYRQLNDHLGEDLSKMAIKFQKR